MANVETGTGSSGEEQQHKNPAKNPSSDIPWEKESISVVGSDLITKIREEILRIKTALIPDGKNDLGILAALLKQTGADIVIPPNIAGLDLYAAADFMGEINTKIFIPHGEILSVMYIGDRAYVAHATIIKDSWKREPYLEDAVYTAKINWLDRPADLCGLSLENFAFVDAEKSRKDAYPMYLIVSRRIPQVPNVIHDLLADQLQQAAIGAKEYCELLGENRLLQEERRHAKDHIFASHVLGPEYDRGDKVAIVNILVKPGSTLEIKPQLRSKQNFACQSKAAGILEHCARLGGVIAEVEALLELNKPDHAFCAFLDYIFMNAIAYESRNSISPLDPNARYMIASRLLFSGIADLGVCSHDALLQGVLQGESHPAVSALNFLTEIYKLDFWDDTERAKIVRDKIQ